MTNVELKSEARTSLSCDRMEIILSLSNDGLSMQASLNRLAECSSQLVSALMNVGLDPSAFAIESIQAQSNPAKDRQSAAVVIRAQAKADLNKLSAIWETLASLSFPVEISVRFEVADPRAELDKLRRQALESLRNQAAEIAASMNLSRFSCTQLSFEEEVSPCSPQNSLGWHTLPANSEPFSLSFFFTVDLPANSCCVRAVSTWQLDDSF